jgi:methionine-rich copper-binding protein CopC
VRRLLALAVALAVLHPPAAAAHASLVTSSPARRAVLAAAPARVELRFSERLEPAYSALSVHDAAGRRVDGHDVAVGPDDRRTLSVSLPRLPAGTYVVRYRVLSVDGHVVESSFPFTVKDGAPR